MKIHVPATTTNLGAGFDVFGLALDLYNELIFSFNTNETKIKTTGKYARDVKDTRLFFEVFDFFEKQTGYKIPPVDITQNCNIPVSSGLGSSAAVIVSALHIANEGIGKKLSQEDLMSLAMKLEGHPDNVLPAFVGGLVVCYQEENSFDYEKFEIDVELTFLIPNFTLCTNNMRKILPQKVPFNDAIFNIKNSCQFLAKIASGRIHEAFKYVGDRLHQSYRINQNKKMKEFVEAIVSKNPSYWFVSGSGPSVCADIKDFSNIPHLREVLRLKVNNKGLVIE
ncbi:homoserine kinase [Thermotoga sp. KOL6]|uniref:homoserine kinase n=1 Tax=Thermotoga sp. KOL6 TaxID=126741 RepID=UPI000C78B0E6|nr:homoserine kinase [Thermotoga sp. KOL6]PLV59263.1 homoserine kinase [Thermotoga sp. KOL6]